VPVHDDVPPACCVPRTSPAPTYSPEPTTGSPSALTTAPRRSPKNTRGQVRVPAGSFAMGDAFGEGYPQDGETPVHPVTLRSFFLDATAVTNAGYATFVKATGYRTEAEQFGSSAVFHLAVPAGSPHVLGVAAGTPWWLNVRGACWRHPEGPDSAISERQNHPVVHIAWSDAQAYCAWAGKRLPTEAEWEYAARGGSESRRFSWGDELTSQGRWNCNIWQGRFPDVNTLDDGFLTTAPVKSFRPNGFGLWNTAGNVWEWCADWFGSDYYAESPRESPGGPDQGVERVMRGGSYLCHASYCNRYRVSARSSNRPDSSTANLGFRCANDG
jgi:formylglycine-generating enzyme